MEQLILHLFGDYVTQTDWMAKKKTTDFDVALIHAAIYMLPFALLTQSWIALTTMFITHALIDRYRLARFVIYAKNWTTDFGLKWADASGTGYHKDMPPWLAFWLLIIVDNLMHLSINYAAIRWL